MNRRRMLLAGLAALPATALPGTAQVRRQGRRPRATAKPARRQGSGLTASHARTRVVNRTFTSTVPINVPIGVGPAFPYPSTIRVSGFRQGRILTVRVTLIGLSHTRPGDLDIMVVAPGNVGVILMSDVGAFADIANLTITFDQNAPNRLPLTPLVSGTFQPVNNVPNPDAFPPPAPPGVTGHSLTRFNNRNPNGTWRLYVVDDVTIGDGGSLAGWTLRIRARVRVPHRHRRTSTRRAKR